MNNSDWRNRSVEAIQQLSLEHTLFSWNIQGSFKPKVITHSAGCYFWDADGNRYLDMTAQLMCVTVGHQHPKVVEAIKKQASEMCYIGPLLTHAPRAELGRLLAEITPGNLTKTFFTLGGAEAIENALKLARAYTGRYKFVTRYRSYHGQTHGAGSVTGESRRWSVEPALPGIVYAPPPYCYRCDLGLSPEHCDLECARYIAKLIEYEDPDKVAGVIVEGVVGANGVLLPEREEYLPLVRQICDNYGVLLIVDEIMSGLGRTGAWFAVDHWGVVPDILTMAKGLTGAHLPLGAVTVSDKIGDYFDNNRLMLGATYSAHPMSCAAAIATLNVLKDEHLIENSNTLGKVLKHELKAMQERHPSIGDVRSIGLFAFVELVKDRKTKQPFGPFSTRVIAPKGEIDDLQRELYRLGVYQITNPLGMPISPPLTITQEQLMDGLHALEEAISLTTDRAYVGLK
jgi:taurine--2-oxoglutarate transaminase